MPVQSCTENGKQGYSYGSGKCYTYTVGDEPSRKAAKRKAYLQGAAIAHSTGEKMHMEKAELPTIMEEQQRKKFTKEEAIQWLTNHNLIADILVDNPWSYSFYQIPVENMYNMENPSYSDYEDGMTIRYSIVNDNINILCVDFDKKQPETIVKMQEDMIKYDDEHNCIFGWGYVSKKATGEQVFDHSTEFVAEEDYSDLELGMYAFNLEYRASDIGHVEKQTGYLIESFVVTKEKLKKMGLNEDALPMGIWCGFFFPNDEDYANIKKMKHPMFSIFGSAHKEFIKEEDNK